MDGNGAGSANDNYPPLKLLVPVIGAEYSAEVDEELEFDRVSAHIEENDGFGGIIISEVVAGATLHSLTPVAMGNTQTEHLGRSRADQPSLTTGFQGFYFTRSVMAEQ